VLDASLPIYDLANNTMCLLVLQLMLYNDMGEVMFRALDKIEGRMKEAGVS
jgi:hypothetical protein